MDHEPESLLERLHAEIHEALDSSEPTSEDVKEVYAQFGLAYYHAEVLYRGLCNLYCASQTPPTGPVTRHRVEEHLRTASEMTLGQLLPKLEPLLPPPLPARLADALERRNFIAHHFWYERIHLITTLTGIDAMVAELAQDTELFQELDREIEKITEPLHTIAGDLSHYRHFEFGASVSQVARITGVEPSDITVTVKRSAKIQDLDWHPHYIYRGDDPVPECVFSFYEGQLFRIVVAYESSKTEGPGVPDLVESISQYTRRQRLPTVISHFPRGTPGRPLCSPDGKIRNTHTALSASISNLAMHWFSCQSG